MSTAEVEIAQQRAEVADLGLKAAEIKLKAASVRQEAAKKAVELAEVAAEHAKQSLELERLRLEHVDCCPEQEDPLAAFPASLARKRARSTDSEEDEDPVVPPAVVAEPAGAPQDAADPVAAAKQEVSAARRELRELQEVVDQQREQQLTTTGRLLIMRRRHRDCTGSRVSVAMEAEWSTTTLKCSSKTVANEAASVRFMHELSEAPCLGTLSLHLRNMEGRFGYARGPLPQSVLLAVAAGPSRIKRLRCLQLGRDGCEAVFALLERAKDHLDEFMISHSPVCALGDEDVRRLWGILVGSNVSELRVEPEFLRDVGFDLEAGSWPRLQRVNFEGSAGKIGMLAPLLRANVANLRAVSLPWKISKEVRRDVFEALAACTGLEELNAPCYKELGLLTASSKLTKLQVHRINMSNSGEDVDHDIQAVGRFLCASSTASRLERFHLNWFKLEIHQALPVYEAIRDLKKLKSLTVEDCDDFDEVLGATLKALPCLEELHLLRCNWLHAEVVTEHVTPENAPKLKLLELKTEVVDEGWREVNKWKKEISGVKARFRRVNHDFRLKDHMKDDTGTSWW